MQAESYSLSSQTWKRFKKNKLAFIALLFILACILLAIFGYVLAPDNTPNADLQTLEIQAKKPRYRQLFLQIPRQRSTRVSLLENLLSGTPAAYDFLPVTAIHVNKNQVVVKKFIDTDTSITQTFSIAELTNNNPKEISKLVIAKTYWLGTDAFGRDILSRLILGTRVSLSVGLIAVIVSLLLGIILGAMAGYYRGWIDEIVMWFINVTWSIPTLLLVFAFTIAMGKGFWQIFIAVGLTMWVSVARLVRGQVMAVKELEYIQSAKTLGYTDDRIIFRHILPNIMGPVLVIAAGNFASAIIIEAGLSFLGIGVQSPQPSWGLMIKENYNFIITHNPILALIPGFAIMLLVLAFNLVGNGLRDAISEH